MLKHNLGLLPPFCEEVTISSTNSAPEYAAQISLLTRATPEGHLSFFSSESVVQT